MSLRTFWIRDIKKILSLKRARWTTTDCKGLIVYYFKILEKCEIYENIFIQYVKYIHKKKNL